MDNNKFSMDTHNMLFNDILRESQSDFAMWKYHETYQEALDELVATNDKVVCVKLSDFYRDNLTTEETVFIHNHMLSISGYWIKPYLLKRLEREVKHLRSIDVANNDRAVNLICAINSVIESMRADEPLKEKEKERETLCCQDRNG